MGLLDAGVRLQVCNLNHQKHKFDNNALLNQVQLICDSAKARKALLS